jgi:hypothetical protein
LALPICHDFGRERGDEGTKSIKHLNHLIRSSCSNSMFNKQCFDHNLISHLSWEGNPVESSGFYAFYILHYKSINCSSLYSKLSWACYYNSEMRSLTMCSQSQTLSSQIWRPNSGNA